MSRTSRVSALHCAMCLLALRVQSRPTSLVYHVEEDCELGTVLADVKTDSNLTSRYSNAVVDRLRFVMLATQSGMASRHLHVDSVTGLVRAATSLDRDAICPVAVDCILNADIAFQPGASFELIKVCTM